MVTLAAGLDLDLRTIDTEIRKEAVTTVQRFLQMDGGNAILELKGRTKIREDVLESLSPIGPGSRTENDPAVEVCEVSSPMLRSGLRVE